MRYPFLSFTIAILFSFVPFLILFIANKKSPTLIPATVEIDSIMFEANEKSLDKNNNKSEKNQKLEKEVFQKKVQKESYETDKVLQTQSNKSSQTNSQIQKHESEKKLLVLYGPLPKIPEHLKSEAFHTYAMVRFYVEKDGSARVELMRASSNPELNYLLLKNLAKWKFETSEKESIQDIKVNFRVENE